MQSENERRVSQSTGERGVQVGTVVPASLLSCVILLRVTKLLNTHAEVFFMVILHTVWSPRLLDLLGNQYILALSLAGEIYIPLSHKVCCCNSVRLTQNHYSHKTYSIFKCQFLVFSSFKMSFLNLSFLSLCFALFLFQFLNGKWESLGIEFYSISFDLREKFNFSLFAFSLFCFGEG